MQNILKMKTFIQQMKNLINTKFENNEVFWCLRLRREIQNQCCINLILSFPVSYQTRV